MLAGWVMFGVLGNDIRFADEILPYGQDEIPARGGDEIRPLVGLGHRDATLLRTRYVDQRTVVNAGACWGQSERSEDIVTA